MATKIKTGRHSDSPRCWSPDHFFPLPSLKNMEKPMFKDKYVHVNGVRLHVVTAGKGPLILFLHGFPEFWYEWKDQLAEFGKDHLAVAPDMRGYNLSDKPEALDQYKINLLVEDVRALADHFSHQKKFVLVAHDWGGAVAWAFAIAHPEMLDKLVIVNAPHPGVFGRARFRCRPAASQPIYADVPQPAGRAESFRRTITGPGEHRAGRRA